MLCKFGEKEYLKSTHTDLMGKKQTVFLSEDEKCKATCQMDGLRIELDREFSTMGEAQKFLEEVRALLLTAWETRQSMKLKLSKTMSGH